MHIFTAMDETKLRDLVRDAYDLHVHVGPDVLPRKYTVYQLAEQERGKIRGLVAKSHAFATITDVISLLDEIGSIEMYGALTLNNFVGGLEPDVIYASATVAALSKKAPLFVWLPTTQAENHLSQIENEYEIPPAWIKNPEFKSRLKTEVRAIKIIENGKLCEEAILVLDMLKKFGCVLATGHLAWQEAKIIAEHALNQGITTIITHPNQRHILMPIEVQKELAEKGAFIEYCYITFKDGKTGAYSLADWAKQIKLVGAEHYILSSDTGQIGNPAPSECLFEFSKQLMIEGLSFDEIQTMIVQNPKQILGKTHS